MSTSSSDVPTPLSIEQIGYVSLSAPYLLVPFLDILVSSSLSKCRNCLSVGVSIVSMANDPLPRLIR